MQIAIYSDKIYRVEAYSRHVMIGLLNYAHISLIWATVFTTCYVP